MSGRVDGQHVESGEGRRIGGGAASRSGPLWRHMAGERLRAARGLRGETLQQVGDRAGVSPQHLSEVERGLKEPSSEVLAAVADALGMTLLDLVDDVAERLREVRAEAQGRYRLAA